MGALADFRERLATTAAEVEYGSSPLRVGLGLDDLADDAEFLNNLLTEGPYLQIRPGQLLRLDGSGGRKDRAEYQVGCDLYVGLDLNDDQPLTTQEDLLDALRAAWSWLDDLRWGEPHVGANFVQYRLEATFDPKD